MRNGAPFKRRSQTALDCNREDLLVAQPRTADDTDKTVSPNHTTLYIIRGADGRPITTRFTKYAAKKRAKETPGATFETVRVCSCAIGSCGEAGGAQG